MITIANATGDLTRTVRVSTGTSAATVNTAGKWITMSRGWTRTEAVARNTNGIGTTINTTGITTCTIKDLFFVPAEVHGGWMHPHQPPFSPSRPSAPLRIKASLSPHLRHAYMFLPVTLHFPVACCCLL